MSHDLVLIVEDEDDIRNDLAAVLQRRGYHTATAENGLVALAYLRTQPPPCLLVLDLMMPVMDGWQLRLEMLNDPRLAAIPVIVLSGAGSLDKVSAAIGAIGYVSKPFALRSLVDVIERYC